MIDILRAFAETLFKMFAGDLWLTVAALCAVGLSAAALRSGVVTPDALPFVLAGGVLLALTISVLRGARS